MRLEDPQHSGESPLWQEQEGKLYWLDLRKPAIYRFDPITGRNAKLKVSLKIISGHGLSPGRRMVVLDQRGIYTVQPSPARSSLLPSRPRTCASSVQRRQMRPPGQSLTGWRPQGSQRLGVFCG